MGVGHPRTQRAPQPLDAVGLRVIGRRIHQHEMATQLLQHVVDAYAAQTARASTKPITLAFALVGLYLHLEKNQTGVAGGNEGWDLLARLLIQKAHVR